MTSCYLQVVPENVKYRKKNLFLALYCNIDIDWNEKCWTVSAVYADVTMPTGMQDTVQLC